MPGFREILQIRPPILTVTDELAGERRQLDLPAVFRCIRRRHRVIGRDRRGIIVEDADLASCRVGVGRRRDVGANPVAGDHRQVVRQARVPNAVIIGRKIILLGEGRNMRSRGIVKDSRGTETREGIVIFEDDDKHVVKCRHALSVVR